MKLPVVFIGKGSNGKIVLDYLRQNKYVEVPLVIEFSDANNLIKKIKKARSDFIFVAGWSDLLSKELIGIPFKGTIGFHPSKLPCDRGRSVLAWQIEEGYTESALTMFYYNELPDCGDIIAQEKFKINNNDYIADVLNKVDNATYNLMRAYFPLLRQGIAPRKPQDISEGNFRRLRTDRDSLIDWSRNTEDIYNKIRAISKPYPGAFTYYDGDKITIWKSECLPNIRKYIPGTVIDLLPDSIKISTGDGAILVTDWEPRNIDLKIGGRLGNGNRKG
jgi:methionyl-tRNA formyltransferase